MIPSFIEVFNHQTTLSSVPPGVQQSIYDATSFLADPTNTDGGGWKPPESFGDEKAWDGRVRLSKWQQNGSGSVPTGLIDLVETCFRQLGHPYQLVDRRVRPAPGFPDFGPIPLRDYQQEAVEAAVQAGHGVLDIPTRGGKTRLAIELTRRLWLPTLWIAPTTNIVTQTLKAFDELCDPNFAVPLKGSKDWQSASEKNVVVCTNASAANLPQEFFDTRQVLIGDEFHHHAAQTGNTIANKCHHIFHRYGLTGTFFRSGRDEMALHAILSKTIYKIGTPLLLERGYLTATKVAFLPIEHPHLPRGSTWDQVAKKGIRLNAYRNEVIAWAATLLRNLNKKTLILVATKEQGYAIRDLLKGQFGQAPKGKEHVAFVSTDVPANICQEHIHAFLHTKHPSVLIGTSMVGEGTDLPSCDALIYAQGGKAEVSHRQAMARVATAQEGKTHAIVLDFADRGHHMVLKHSVERGENYAAEPTVELHALQTIEELPSWLAWIESRGLAVLHK